MKILKKFNQFINEDVDNEFDKSDMITELEDDAVIDDSLASEEEFSNEADDDFSDEVEETEEESGQYIGTKLMNELATKLGTKVVNNAIDYEGKKINYYSETEAFHVGNNKFDSIEEVLSFLESDSNES